MTDPRTIIERAAERVVPKHDAFERLERARARKTLNRRITAAVVAVLVAIGGSYAAFAAFGGAGGTIAGGSSGFHALWPEQTLDAAQQEQTAVDGGADAWRTDPKQVATRFVTDVLGWSGFQTEVVPGDLNIYVFSTPTPPCPSPTTTAGQTCPSLELQSREVTVDVRQLLGTGPSAIWSVFSVASPAVPVHFVPASRNQASATIPSVANVTCDATNTEVATPVVEPQPDGVHISVQNTSGTNLGIEVKDVGGENATAGTSETVWQFGPGTYQVRCTPNGNEAPGAYQALEVQDPEHLWVSNELDCNAVTGVNADYVPGATGDKTPPIELLQEHVTGLEPNDVLEAAGYSDAPNPQVRVVRDGTVIAVYQFMSDGQGGWLLSSSQQCSDSNLSWQEASSSPYPRGAFTWCPTAPFPPFVGDWRLSGADVAQKVGDLDRSGDGP